VLCCQNHVVYSYMAEQRLLSQQPRAWLAGKGLNWPPHCELAAAGLKSPAAPTA
jgi:hypothetical protein